MDPRELQSGNRVSRLSPQGEHKDLWGSQREGPFRVAESPVTAGRPNGIKYAFTLHDTDGVRLLGFDNAHGVPRATAFDRRHRLRRTQELLAYDFIGADELICDFFDAVAQACRQEGVAFDFVDEDIELEDDDEADESV